MGNSTGDRENIGHFYMTRDKLGSKPMGQWLMFLLCFALLIKFVDLKIGSLSNFNPSYVFSQVIIFIVPSCWFQALDLICLR